MPQSICWAAMRKCCWSETLAKNGKRQLLAANVVPKTPQNNVPGTVVTRAIVAQDDDGKWTELLRV